MRWPAVALVAAGALLPSGVTQAAMSPVRTAVSATFLLECGNYTGTAWQFSPGRYLTANHVVAHCRVPLIVSSSGTHASKVVLHNTIDDIAELMSSFIAPSSVPLSRSVLTTNERLYVRAAPGGVLGTTSGTLLRESSVDGIPSIELSASVNPGSSGGVVVDEAGAAVGLVQKKSSDPATGIAIRQPFITQFLQRKLVGTKVGPLQMARIHSLATGILWLGVGALFVPTAFLWWRAQRRHRLATKSVQIYDKVPVVLGRVFWDGDK